MVEFFLTALGGPVALLGLGLLGIWAMRWM